VLAQRAFTYAPPLQTVFCSAVLAPPEVAVVLSLGPLIRAAAEIGEPVAWLGAKAVSGA
jgi:hypothetical protein